ncbi:CHAT domain-containing protein [[Leptolyngbya] sp. PCC 7376]|uniref:CHAT domain-containing protein n=1 Tax=[Leptolyngbya] sp. PCC 7376 TaxID=111781 RepID=UPI0002F22A2B|nr:CHAT domain-containing protein [[Leptolyngbya] sp. PCC 7376]
MSQPPDFPSLQVVCDRLNNSPEEHHFVIWAAATPFVRGVEKEDILWDEELSRIWLAWQAIFTPHQTPHYPITGEVQSVELVPDPNASISGRLMQGLGVQMWQWLFQGAIAESFARAEGVALGQKEALRLRIDVRDPNLLPLPWEIMQQEMGKQAVSLNPQVFFSRTIGDVAPLNLQSTGRSLNILLVLGAPENGNDSLDLKTEAERLQNIWQTKSFGQVQGDILIQPTPSELAETLSSKNYQLFFYSGHGEPAADGGQIFLNDADKLNGKELAQILTQSGIRLTVFNSCWGAKSLQQNHQAIATSSLTEVLIHHGLPSVLAMRDPISDDEAIAFITSLSQAFCKHKPVDESVAIARQNLLAQFKFNSPAWTLPILYMHPEFDGQILSKLSSITELPTRLPTPIKTQTFTLSSCDDPEREWTFSSKLIRIGRRSENDVTIEEPWVSKEHAEIIQREEGFFIRDRSRFGTLISLPNQDWQNIHQEEILLLSNSHIRLGSEQGETFKFSAKKA